MYKNEKGKRNAVYSADKYSDFSLTSKTESYLYYKKLMSDQKHFLLASFILSKCIKQLKKNFRVSLIQTKVVEEQVWRVNLKLGKSYSFLLIYLCYLFLQPQFAEACTVHSHQKNIK